MESIDINDPSTYIIGGSVILASCLIAYNCWNCYKPHEKKSEVELTTNEKQDFSNIDNEITTQTDLESQQRTVNTQTDDTEFYNVMSSQIDNYIKNKRRRNVYEYEDSD